MKETIRKVGPFRMTLHSRRFHFMVHSILSQQISGNVARAIGDRLHQAVAPDSLTPEALLRFTPENLRAIGVSRQKSVYLLDLAGHVAQGSLRLDRLGKKTDAQVVEELTQVKGIGVWTAQMFLMFVLGRLDIFPEQDLGIRTAIRNLYGLDGLPDKQTSLDIAEAWKPYCSIASWYCWRSLE